jgi:hypothetical protein
MTRADIELMLTDLAETTRYLGENRRRIREVADQIRRATPMTEHGNWNEFDGAMADVAAGLRRAAEGLRRAAANQRLCEASPQAGEEHGDVRDAVAQLEKLVLEVQTDIRALLNRNGGQ